jgi:predicted DNA-binding transcriptional regulator AlpA
MTNPEAISRQLRQARPPPVTDRAAYTIAEFCDAHRISRSHYYVLKKQGHAPREVRVGTRVLVTVEAATRWRKAREKATAA